jgi:hypothetical protein
MANATKGKKHDIVDVMQKRGVDYHIIRKNGLLNFLFFLFFVATE